MNALYVMPVCHRDEPKKENQNDHAQTEISFSFFRDPVPNNGSRLYKETSQSPALGHKNMSVIAIGDLHGDFSVLEAVPAGEGDIIIILGDAGFLFDGSEKELEEIRRLSEYPFLIAFLDGNHDNLLLIESYPIEIWMGGPVHRLSPRLIHLIRGSIYTINEKRYFVFGGGVSADKAARREGFDYWRKELPSPEEYGTAWENLLQYDFRVDYILCHTAPTDAVYALRGSLKHPDEEPLNNFLLKIRHAANYNRLLFGHFHRDLELPDRQTAVYRRPAVLDASGAVSADLTKPTVW